MDSNDNLALFSLCTTPGCSVCFLCHHTDFSKAAVKVQDPQHSSREDPHSCHRRYSKRRADVSFAGNLNDSDLMHFFFSLNFQNVVVWSLLVATIMASWVWKTSRNTKVSRSSLGLSEGKYWPKCHVEMALPSQPPRVRTVVSLCVCVCHACLKPCCCWQVCNKHT